MLWVMSYAMLCAVAVEDVNDSYEGTILASEKLVTEHNCTILFAPYVSCVYINHAPRSVKSVARHAAQVRLHVHTSCRNGRGEVRHSSHQRWLRSRGCVHQRNHRPAVV